MKVLLAIVALVLAGPPAAAQGFRPGGEQSVPNPADVEDTDWWWWWHFNKDAYLQLRRRVFERQPATGGSNFNVGIGERIVEKDPAELSAYELRSRIVPALMAGLEGDPATEPGDGMIGACLLALAKIGPRGEYAGQDPFDEVFIDFLDHSSATIRGQATLALGVFGRTDSITTLRALLLDTHEGHRLTDLTEVSVPIRSFAAYALGLIGSRTPDMGVRREIVSILRGVLDGPSFAQRDIKVACMSAFGVVPIEPVAPEDWQPPRRRRQGQPRLEAPDPTESRESQIRYLLHYFADVRTNHDLVRSHVPTALARLLDGADPRMREEVLPPLMEVVRKFTDERKEVQQSVVLALGRIADADDDKEDREVYKTLERYVGKGDQNSRRYALISLGLIAARAGLGEEPFAATPGIAKFIMRQVGPLGESRVAPWAALGLGVMARALAEQRRLPPDDVLEEMREGLEKCRSPIDIGGFALALGLARDLDALDTLVEKLEVFAMDTQLGHLTLSMGMIGDEAALEPLVAQLEQSMFRGERMELVSVALAVLGEPDRVPMLLELLERAGSQESQGPIVAALGVTGDRRVIDPLVAVLLDDDRYTEAVRATAAFGLGIVADKDLLPWRARYSAGVNYTSAPPTLLGAGILDYY